MYRRVRRCTGVCPNPLPSTTAFHCLVLFPQNKRTHLLSRPHFFLISYMDQSGSSHLRALFELALRDYESTTNISLAKHPLAEKLEKCNSVESITVILQDQAKGIRGNDRIMRSVGSMVSVLDQLSTIATLSGAISLVRQKTMTKMSHITDLVLKVFPPATAIQAGLGVLLAVRASPKLLRAYR